jgi:hypothetical protein
VLGAVGADQVESGINALLAAGGVGMCWWLLGRVGVVRLSDRLWLTVLFAFSTQVLWVTTRGGVWHTGHLVATILTFACLIGCGAKRAWLIGLLGGRIPDPGTAGLRHAALCVAAGAIRSAARRTSPAGTSHGAPPSRGDLDLAGLGFHHRW